MKRGGLDKKLSPAPGVGKKPTTAPEVDKNRTPALRGGKKLPPESGTRFKAWITKYALSRGVFEDMVEDCFDTSPTMVSSIHESNYYHRDQWHRTREAALEKAEKMRVARIASLQRQIGELRKLTFDKTSVPEEG